MKNHINTLSISYSVYYKRSMKNAKNSFTADRCIGNAFFLENYTPQDYIFYIILPTRFRRRSAIQYSM